jgi:hypothetical protein
MANRYLVGGLHRQVGGLRSLEHAINVNCSAPELVGKIDPIRIQATLDHVSAIDMNRGQFVSSREQPRYSDNAHRHAQTLRKRTHTILQPRPIVLLFSVRRMGGSMATDWLAITRVFFASTFSLVLVSWLHTAAAAPRYSAHVYVLRGIMNVFSPGLDSLTEKIQKRGIPASVHNHLAWPSLTEEAIRNYRNGRAKSIIVIGHSLGAGAAVSMAEQLRQAGVPVQLVVTLDPVSKPAFSANVKQAYNFYVSNGIGTSAERAPKSRTALTNVDRNDLGHVSITTAPDIHRKVLSYVTSAVAPLKPQSAPAAAAIARGEPQLTNAVGVTRATAPATAAPAAREGWSAQ